jgi:hypothetical protein
MWRSPVHNLVAGAPRAGYPRVMDPIRGGDLQSTDTGVRTPGSPVVAAGDERTG